MLPEKKKRKPYGQVLPVLSVIGTILGTIASLVQWFRSMRFGKTVDQAADEVKPDNDQKTDENALIDANNSVFKSSGGGSGLRDDKPAGG